MRHFFYLVIFLSVSFLPLSLKGQDTIVFELKDLFGMIFENHPVASQANLLPRQAREQLRIARGAFDPTIGSSLDYKEFNGTHYYTVWQNELKVPTWPGIDLRAGYEMNNGNLLNQQNTVPDQGLFYAGVSLPIGQGLLIDHRRAVLRQADIFSEIADSEKILQINDLLLKASVDYWDWMYYYNRYKLYQTGYDFSVIRYEAVRERVNFGDLAPIDSVEATIEVQLRKQNLDQARVDYNNAMLRLSNHLWSNNWNPVELTENFIPPEDPNINSLISLGQLEQLIEKSREQHPFLQVYKSKLAQLDIERKYKADLIKPSLNLNLNLLQSPISFENENINMERFSNNYKIGGSFSFPLFVRKQRGELKLTKLHIESTELELLQKTREISNKIKSVYNELINFSILVSNQEMIVSNYQILRNGEETRFRNGESSLFLINTREKQLIDSQIKFFELQAKYALSQTKLNWEAGTIQEEQ